MDVTSSAPQVAERIYACEIGGAETVEEAIAAVRMTHAKLARALSPVLGDAGFNAVFARSVQRAKAADSRLKPVGSTPSETLLESLCRSLATLDHGAAGDAVVGLLASLVGLLSTFIGPELASRLLASQWPEATVIASAETS